MTDVLLIQPPIRDFYLTAKRTIPYGLACIAAALMKEGFSVEILDGLATSKSRIIPWPDEMDYLRQYYGKPDTSPFGAFSFLQAFRPQLPASGRNGPKIRGLPAGHFVAFYRLQR